MSKITLIFYLGLPILFVTGFSLTEEPLPGISTLIVPAAVITLLIILNGLFVLAEFAIIGVRPSQVEALSNEGHGTAKKILVILRSSDHQNRYIATAQLGITLASLGLGMYGEPQIAHFIEPYLAWALGLEPHAAIVGTIGYLLSLGILTYLHIVVGEMVPKSLALSAPQRAVFAIYQPMRLIQVLFGIPVRALNGLSDMLLRLFRIPLAEGQSRLYSPEELSAIISESAEAGQLLDGEKEMLRKIFIFNQREAHQVMTPGPKIEAIAYDMPLPELLIRMTDSTFSRLPVYRDNLDNIVGVLHIKDLVRHQLRSKGSFDLRLLLRPIPAVPEHYPVKKLLATFKHKRTHLAVVLNEFGGTAGVVTLEDLVEEVVGEVRDEFDSENDPIVRQTPGDLEVAGHVLIDELRAYVPLEEAQDLPDVETVSGLIIASLGRLPQVGDQVTYGDNIHFTVLSVAGRAVERARVEHSAF